MRQQFHVVLSDGSHHSIVLPIDADRHTSVYVRAFLEEALRLAGRCLAHVRVHEFETQQYLEENENGAREEISTTGHEQTARYAGANGHSSKEIRYV